MYTYLSPDENEKYRRLAAEFEQLNDKSRDFLERYTALLAQLCAAPGRTRPRDGKTLARGGMIFPARGSRGF
jgi:hypothetical protein